MVIENKFSPGERVAWSAKETIKRKAGTGTVEEIRLQSGGRLVYRLVRDDVPITYWDRWEIVLEDELEAAHAQDSHGCLAT